MSKFAIQTTGLTKQFGTHRAVDNVNLKVPEGAICGFLGKNGAGKTTTLKMIVGLTKPTCGSISLMGVERRHSDNDNTRIGYLPDVPNFYGYMTAPEYLAFCGKLYAIDNRKLKRRIDEILNRVGLKGVKKQISDYSRGMKQRLGIAQSLINEPSIVFLDEPVSALDPIGRHEVMALIRSLRGITTIFFSTHILADVENTCDFALILEKGKVVADGSIENLKQKHTANTALLRLYTPMDSKKFQTAAQNHINLTIEEISATELRIRSDDIRVLGKQIPALLTETDISMEKFEPYTPSIEDIFLEVTDRE